MSTVFIYALNCPVTGRTRYIGKAKDPRHRFKGHMNRTEPCYRTSWIHSLRVEGLKPIMEIVDEVPEELWQPIEAAYIQFFREEGFDLVNTTPGGEGLSNPSPETRARMSAAQLALKKTLPAKHRANISAAHLGKPKSFEQRQKMSIAGLGKSLSEETRARMSAAAKIRSLLSKRCNENGRYCALE